MFLSVLVGSSLTLIMSQPSLFADLYDAGKSSCIGKNLALMDIKLVISSIVQKYHINFDPLKDSRSVLTDMQDHFTVTPGPLSLIFKPRA